MNITSVEAREEQTPDFDTSTPIDRSSMLACKSMKSLLEFFSEHTQHRPSGVMKSALWEVSRTIFDMALGITREGNSDIYLSSLDPGIGKTQIVTHSIRTLLDEEDLSDVGVMVCVSRLDEIKAYVEAMELDPSMYAVLTSNQELNSMGLDDPTQAKVLFTTQQMVERRCKHQDSFIDIEPFQYKSEARMVKIWDESILPGQGLTLDTFALHGLIYTLRRNGNAKLSFAVEDFLHEVEKQDDKTCIIVPEDLLSEGEEDEDEGTTLNTVLGALASRSEDSHIQAITTLSMLLGRKVTIRRNGKYRTVLDYDESFPPDFYPVLALDASGRVRGTYEEWEQKRGGLRRLMAAPKNYDNLNVHVWRRSGSKSGFKKDKREKQLIAGIVKTIQEKPDEEWLIVHHKKTLDYDVERDVFNMLPSSFPAKDKLHFITWGNHHATNKYSRIKNVILAGTLFYSNGHYEALGRLSAGHTTAFGPYPSKGFNTIQEGEHKHLILQAACRGAVRLSQGSSCAPCELYIIAATESKIPNMLDDIFPGCKVNMWKGVDNSKELSGRAKEAYDYLIKHFTLEEAKGIIPSEIGHAKVKKAIGIKDTPNYNKSIKSNQTLIDALNSQGIKLDKSKGFIMFFGLSENLGAEREGAGVVNKNLSDQEKQEAALERKRLQKKQEKDAKTTGDMLRGNQKKLFDYVVPRLTKEKFDTDKSQVEGKEDIDLVMFYKARQAIGMKDKTNFRKLRNHPKVVAALFHAGVVQDEDTPAWRLRRSVA